MELDLSSLEEPQEIPHEFEIDLNCIVVTNHALTLEGINRSEDEELAKIEEGFAHEDFETVRSITGYLQNFYEDLRQAAHRLALVGLITRLQHWVERFAEQTNVKKDKIRDSLLANQIEALNKLLGPGPTPVSFFQDLVTVRDSIIHADSKAEWEHNGKPRRVANHYRNAFDVELNEEHLKEAVQKTTEQVKWYDEKINASRISAKSAGPSPGSP